MRLQAETVGMPQSSVNGFPRVLAFLPIPHPPSPIPAVNQLATMLRTASTASSTSASVL